MSIYLIINLLLIILTLRTISWHLQCWQIREYRFDRLKAWLNTQDGKQFFIPWVSAGIWPRPKLSFRVLLISVFAILLWMGALIAVMIYPLMLAVECSIQYKMDPVGGFQFCSAQWFNKSWVETLALLFAERLIWLFVGLSVLISNVPVRLKKLHLFYQAGKVIKNADQNITRIGITGSYGKSSTKELLVHLLKSEFGKDAVLYNPANENTEVAIARLILSNQAFFKSSLKPKFLVIETGAYKKGEIGTVAKMIQPQYSILTGLNQQHVELFGSIEKTREAKFELAEGTSKTVFFNSDNAYLKAIFNDQKITATNVPISFKAAQNLKASAHKTDFEEYGQRFTLPWPGEFFVHNTLLALELCREIGISPANLVLHLEHLPPLDRALSLTEKPQGYTLLRDTYSANPDGVLSAIDHLKNFPGQKIFVSIPLRELGGHAETVHEQIFEKLAKLEVEVFWEKSDFAELGKKVLGENFHRLDNNFELFEAKIKSLKAGDVVLLESKLSQKVLNRFK
ncbi:hypothetical protein GW756_03700 [bacterium]|nr:hypothetical protein [bacterium]NCQ55376.1 hypothetical protein [Candidatus Parcubacteria bacterium]NCS67738.1 hypothetical protein [Candidatus Peregrinibacteria bacterium]NCS96448.1 hypothetical protein [bacterium]